MAAAVRALAAPAPLLALAHLLTPVSCVVGLQVRVVGSALTFRGATAWLDEDDLDASAVRARAVVATAQRPGDRFLDLVCSPADWVKAVRSGAHVLMAGGSELFGSPLIRVEARAWSSTLEDELRQAVAGHGPDVVTQLAGHPHDAVGGEGGVVTIRSGRPAPTDSTTVARFVRKRVVSSGVEAGHPSGPQVGSSRTPVEAAASTGDRPTGGEQR